MACSPRVLLAVAIVACALTFASAASLIVTTESGQIKGYTEANVDKFKGIPYAAPPVGDLRFATPQPAVPWSGVLETTSPGPICPQLYIKLIKTWSGKEDCLYMDIYAPTNRTSDEPLPVLFWIYGGGWRFGDGIEFGLYDATNFVNAHNVIVVAFNYRLGPLGFMALPALKAENSAGSVGSYGIYDQNFAMKWVQRNIGNFGGDPTKVTIAGESAGAFSSCIHLASPLSAGLFRGAILESGTCASEIFFVDQQRSFDWSETFIQYSGCDPKASNEEVLACIRGLDLNQIMGPSENVSWTGYVPLMFPDMPWSATIDGVLLTDTPFRVIASGEANIVPVIAGTNHDEGILFATAMQDVIPALHNPLAAGDMDLLLNHFFGNNATVNSLVDAVYPLSNYANATEQISIMIRDFFFVCPTSRALLGLNSFGAQTWMYQWVYHGDWIEDPSLGDYHSAELEFVFDNAWPPLIHKFSARDQAMADAFGTYWSQFIKTGNPNGAAGATSPQPNWPVYEPTQLNSQALDVPPSTVSALLESQCNMWDEINQYAPPMPSVSVRRMPQRPVVVEQPKIALE